MFEGRATRQLSGTRKPNPWALTAPYFGPIEGLGYIWTCTRQIYPEVPLNIFFVAKVVRNMDLGGSQQCVIFGCNVY